jgi:hypothetical protein
VTVGRRDLAAVLAATPVGPRLSELLASLDVGRLSGSDCVDVLQAQYRQVNHERARLLAVIAELVLRDDPDGPGCTEQPTEFAFDEVRAALVWTRRAADAVCELAYDLINRLPAVHAALASGVLDEPKARIFSEWTRELNGTHAAQLCDALLPAAPAWTTGQLIEQIKRYAIALEPEWARHRYEEAVRGRRVVGTRNSDGSANLAGYDLPVDQVAAACARIDRLAKAAKHAGRVEPIDFLRAELFLGLTDGSYAGLDDAAILAQLAAGLTDSADVVAGQAVATPDHPSAPAVIERQSSTARPAVGRPSRRGLELQARLTTLLGRDRHPAELAGWGPIHAELARDIAASHAGGHWRYVVTDRHGLPVAAGPLRRRPAGWTRTGRAGGIEIQVPEPELQVLAATTDLPDGWARVVAEIVAGLDHRGPAAGNPTARLPSAALRRWLQVRDRTCVFPTCRAPARDCDADHTLEHARGGATTDPNLDSPCRHDHRLRHDGGWRLLRLGPGHYLWISRLGRPYHRRPRPVTPPLPRPMPGTGPAGPDPPLTDRKDWAQTSCMAPPPEPAREPPAPPATRPAPTDDQPPF